MALALPAPAIAAPKPFFDVRDQAREVAPSGATRALERRLGDQAVVDVDPVTRTPRVLARLDGALAGPAAGTPEDVALRYVRANLAALGLTESDLGTLQAPRTETVAGITTVRWRQAVDGIASADSELRVNLDDDGRVLNVLGSPAAGLSADTSPGLSAGQAVRAVQDDVGVYRALTRKSGARAVTYDDGTTSKLTLYTGRLAWRVVYQAGADAVYDVMVDADTGKLLRRANLVKSAVMARVWETNPGGTAVDRDIEPWLTDPARLFGENAHTYVDADDDPDTTQEIAPGSYPFASIGCPLCSWSTGDRTTNRNQNAVQAFYFANKFHDHLATLGFDEFEGVQRVLVEASDAADFGAQNNASMLTLPAPAAPVMSLQLWNRDGRNTNAGDDAGIVYHEYTHGLTNRLITDAAFAGALNSAQAGAMGEGWSDWYAQDFLNPTDTAADGEIHMGAYMGESIREQALDCRPNVSSAKCAGGGFTYGDFGKILGGPEVHADGEIWAQTLWDLRRALGADAARSVITEALPLTPAEPSFLDARNAILVAADDAQDPEVWSVFAARGMGYYATTSGSEDVTPSPDDKPGRQPDNGTIGGFLQDAQTGEPIAGATITIGGLPEYTRTTLADGRYTMNLPRRTYTDVVFSKPGYDRVIKQVTVGATPVNLGAELRRNWASYATGARAAGGDALKGQGCGSLATIDGRPGSTWSVDSTFEPATMVVTLPGPVNVRAFGVDPTEGCMDGDDSAAAKVLIQTSATSDSGPWTTAANPTFTAAHRRRMNLVPANANGVRYVRVTIQSTQGFSPYRDISEFGVYSLAPPAVTPTPTPTPTPTATPDPPGPEPTAIPTVAPTAVPTVVPTPSPTATPTAKPRFTLAASGKGAIKVRARCEVACEVRAELTVDAKTAKRLGTARKVGTYRRTLRAGTTTFTVKVSSKVKRALVRKKVKSVKATLRVRSGAETTSRKVTVRR